MTLEIQTPSQAELHPRGRGPCAEQPQEMVEVLHSLVDPSHLPIFTTPSHPPNGVSSLFSAAKSVDFNHYSALRGVNITGV
jgi:hypothetical protein